MSRDVLLLIESENFWNNPSNDFYYKTSFIFIFMNKCASLYLPYVCSCPQMSEDSVEVTRPGVTQTCELPAL